MPFRVKIDPSRVESVEHLNTFRFRPDNGTGSRTPLLVTTKPLPFTRHCLRLRTLRFSKRDLSVAALASGRLRILFPPWSDDFSHSGLYPSPHFARVRAFLDFLTLECDIPEDNLLEPDGG